MLNRREKISVDEGAKFVVIMTVTDIYRINEDDKIIVLSSLTLSLALFLSLVTFPLLYHSISLYIFSLSFSNSFSLSLSFLYSIL